MKRKMVIAVLVVTMIGLAGLGLQNVWRSKESEASLGQDGIKATNFVLSGLDGRKHALIEKGKPTVIHFWTSWCSSCKAEFPMLQKMYDQYKDDFRFQMVNLSLEDDPNEVRRLIQKENYGFPVLFDFTGEVGEVYQVVSVPTTYFVDQEGWVQKKVMGVMSETQFKEMAEMMKKSIKD